MESITVFLKLSGVKERVPHPHTNWRLITFENTIKGSPINNEIFKKTLNKLEAFFFNQVNVLKRLPSLSGTQFWGYCTQGGRDAQELEGRSDIYTYWLTLKQKNFQPPGFLLLNKGHSGHPYLIPFTPEFSFTLFFTFTPFLSPFLSLRCPWSTQGCGESSANMTWNNKKKWLWF